MRLGDVLKFVPYFAEVAVCKGDRTIARSNSEGLEIPTSLDDEVVESIYGDKNTLVIYLRESNLYLR